MASRNEYIDATVALVIDDQLLFHEDRVCEIEEKEDRIIIKHHKGQQLCRNRIRNVSLDDLIIIE